VPASRDPNTRPLPAAHRLRLRAVWRSAGWPYRDPLEVELIAAGLLSQCWDADGRDTVRLTADGIAALARTTQQHRAARDAHERLVEAVARTMQRAGRLAWRGLALRAPLPGTDGATRWAMAMPDVYSIRPSPLEDRLEPIVHEIKVRRADLLADLRRPDKGAAYRAVATQCWYVLSAGIAEPDEVPLSFGVLLADDGGALRVARPAPVQPCRIAVATWLVLARATPLANTVDEAQGLLGGAEASEDAPEARHRTTPASDASSAIAAEPVAATTPGGVVLGTAGAVEPGAWAAGTGVDGAPPPTD
jgi:hypothetical protein